MMQGDFWVIDSEQKLKNFQEFLGGAWEQHHWLQIQIKTGKLRTTRQNAALHAFFRDVSNELNAKGITWQQFFKRFEFEFTEHIVKENVWKPVQKAVTGKDKTSELERDEVSTVYDHINMKLSEHGVYVPFSIKGEG